MGQDFLKLGKLKQGSHRMGWDHAMKFYLIPKYPKESHLIYFCVYFKEPKNWHASKLAKLKKFFNVQQISKKILTWKNFSNEILKNFQRRNFFRGGT